MANDLTSNPLFIDTANGAKTGDLSIQSIAWVADQTGGKDIAADDDFLLTDTAGRRLAGKRATVAGDDGFWSFPNGLRVDGIIVTALDGGHCYIYIR